MYDAFELRCIIIYFVLVSFLLQTIYIVEIIINKHEIIFKINFINCLIQNRCNSNEILIMGGAMDNNIVIFNIKTNKYSKLSDNDNIKEYYQKHLLVVVMVFLQVMKILVIYCQ